MKRLLTGLGQVPTNREKLAALCVAALLAALIVAADAATGRDVLVGGFYVFPILVATWFLGRAGGMFFTFATTAAWAAMRIVESASPTLALELILWNALLRLVAMGTVAHLLSRARYQGFELRTALDRTALLPDVIPICAWCRKLGTDRDEWQTLEQFLTAETDALLTHGVCPGCVTRVREESQAELAARATRSMRSKRS